MMNMIRGIESGGDDLDDGESIDLQNAQIQKYLDRYIIERTISIEKSREGQGQDWRSQKW